MESQNAKFGCLDKEDEQIKQVEVLRNVKCALCQSFIRSRIQANHHHHHNHWLSRSEHPIFALSKLQDFALTLNLSFKCCARFGKMTQNIKSTPSHQINILSWKWSQYRPIKKPHAFNWARRTKWKYTDVYFVQLLMKMQHYAFACYLITFCWNVVYIEFHFRKRGNWTFDTNPDCVLQCYYRKVCMFSGISVNNIMRPMSSACVANTTAFIGLTSDWNRRMSYCSRKIKTGSVWFQFVTYRHYLRYLHIKKWTLYIVRTFLGPSRARGRRWTCGAIILIFMAHILHCLYFIRRSTAPQIPIILAFILFRLVAFNVEIVPSYAMKLFYAFFQT